MRVLTLLLLAALVFAKDEDLVAIGLNAKGAEEFYRVRDEAVVVRVPGGTFLRRRYEGGVAVEEPVAFPVPSFLIDKHEVTNAQFARFLDESGAAAGTLVDVRVPGLECGEAGWRASPGLERHPVTAATGVGALAYAKWVGGAIPNAAQWEKAAGGPDGFTFPWGEDEPDAPHANFARGGELSGPMPVGSFPGGASPYGCLDMAGNVYDRVMTARRDGRMLPAMLKGGSWVSPHPLNLRVADLCMQPVQVADRSVGFRCAMADPEPDRAPRKAGPRAVLTLQRSLRAAVEQATRRGVPIFLSLQFDTCGQCDRTRAQLFRDRRFVAYCNERMVVVVGHRPAPQAGIDGHEENEDGSCPLYPGIDCLDHHEAFAEGLKVVRVFSVSPGNFVLDPTGTRILVRERDLPKWGNAVDAYLQAFEGARRQTARASD